MTLEGRIRNSAGESTMHTVEAATYEEAFAKMRALAVDGSTLLWVRVL